MAFSLADLSPSSNLNAAFANVASARDWIAQGDVAPDTKATLDAYRRSTGQSEVAAMTAQSVADTLASTNSSLTSYYAAATNMAQSATASVDDAGRTTNPTTARTAAFAGIQAANGAIAYATQATQAASQAPHVTLGTVGLLLAGVALAGAAIYYVRRLR